MARSSPPLRVSVLAIPEAMLSSLSGVYDVLNCFELLGSFDRAVPDENPFRPEIVACAPGPMETASGLSLVPQRTLDEVAATEVVIIPSVMVERGEWVKGRHAQTVAWLERMHAGGAMLCSACSGVLLMAETGLLDGREATIHWAYARTFASSFPAVRLRLEKVLVASGERREFVMSGASASWHDLILYLVARHVGPAGVRAIAKFLLLQWHGDGQAPYIVFDPPLDHGDAAILEAQRWLAGHFQVANPVAEVVRLAGLPERTFKRRFKRATGHSVLAYVQRLRVEEAKGLLENGNDPIDEISWRVGYEDPAFFRRLFKRVARITPGAYRRKFRLPEFAAAELPGEAPG